MVLNEIKQRNKLYIPGSPCEIFNKEIIKKTKEEKKLIDESLSVFLISIKAWQGQQACYFKTEHQNQNAYMQITLAWILRKSVTFVTSTFSETETFNLSLLFAMDAMMLHYMQYC